MTTERYLYMPQQNLTTKCFNRGKGIKRKSAHSYMYILAGSRLASCRKLRMRRSFEKTKFLPIEARVIFPFISVLFDNSKKRYIEK